MLPPGEGGQDKGNGPRADFLMLAASGVSTTRSRTRDLGLGRKPEHLGTALPPSQCDRQFPLQGFLYTNHKDKFAEGPIVARYLAATTYLSKALYNYDDPPGEEGIRPIAFHEVCEVLLAMIMVCAETRYVSCDEIE